MLAKYGLCSSALHDGRISGLNWKICSRQVWKCGKSSLEQGAGLPLFLAIMESHSVTGFGLNFGNCREKNGRPFTCGHVCSSGKPDVMDDDEVVLWCCVI